MKDHVFLERQARRGKWIDRAGAHDRDLARAGAARGLDHIRVHHAVIVEQRALILEACHDAVNARGGVEDMIGPAPLELREGRGRIDEIAVGPGQGR